MKTRTLIAAAILALATAARAATIPSPSEFLGMTVGADRTVADYRQILAYFKALDAASPRVEVEILGKTTLGEDLFMAAISSEANLANKKRLQEIARKIADPRGLTEAETRGARRARARSSSSSPATSTRPRSAPRRWRWSGRTRSPPPRTRRRSGASTRSCCCCCPRSTPTARSWRPSGTARTSARSYEGGRMPWLYHHYVGHDNNRDWFMLTQKETQAVTRAVYHEWFPQVWLDEHQMGSTGPRIFMPPYAEPVDPDIHPLVWRDVNLIGANMALPPRAGRQERRHLRLRLRRLLARRHEEHRLVEERLRPPHRGGLGALRDARPDRAERALGRRQGPRRVRHADQLPEPVAGRDVAPARHHGLRADRLRRDPRDLRRAARRLPDERPRARARRDRDVRPERRLPDPGRRSATRPAPPGSPRSSPSTGWS